MSDCRLGVSTVNYPDPDPDAMALHDLQPKSLENNLPFEVY